MPLSHRDKADLDWFLGPGLCEFFRSPFGRTLEWAENRGYTSDGHRIHVAKFGGQQMKVHRETREASYTPDLENITRFAEVSRKLRALEALDPASCLVLETYFGDSGCRWGEQSPLGRPFSIYHLTPTGKKMAKDLRAKFQTTDAVRDDEILATELDLQKRQPNDIRQHKIWKMCDEAESLILKAISNWTRACKGLEEARRRVA